MWIDKGMVGEGKVAKAFALTEALGEAVQHRACVLRPWGQVLQSLGLSLVTHVTLATFSLSVPHFY